VRNRSRRADGLTLVELTATLAITSLIAVAVLPVTSNLSRAETLGQRTSARHLYYEALRALLELDLAHADRYRLTDEGMEFLVHVALSPGTLEVQHVPATVAYAVRRVGGRGWLVRSQRSRQGGDLDEPVCADVRTFRLVPEGDPPKAEEAEWYPMPPSVRASVEPDGPGPAPLEFRVVLR
jgi:hypothetical protein